MISLTRRYHFPASHRLHSLHLSEAENARVYGKCNNPFGHGHDYILEVTVSGQINKTTGLLLPTSELDHFVAGNVLRLFAYRNINLDVPQFARLVPTTENVACVISEILRDNWSKFFQDLPIRPTRIHIQETDRNSFEILLPALEIPSAQRNESVMVHA